MTARYHRVQRDMERRRELEAGATRLRQLAGHLPWWRIDRVDDRLVVLDGGTIVLVIPDARGEDMIRYTRVFNRLTTILLADLLDVAARDVSAVPAPIIERLLELAQRSDVDTDLHPPRRLGTT